MICPLILTTLSRRNVILKLASSSNVRTPRYPPPLMKLPPTCTFNFTPSSLFLPVPPPLCVCLLPSFLSQQSPFTFFFFFPPFSALFFSLTFLTTVRNPVSQVRCVISHWVHILLVLDPFCVVIVYSLIAAFYAYLSTTVSPPRVLVYHVLSTEILRTPFEPHLFACLSASFREPVLQSRPSSRPR